MIRLALTDADAVEAASFLAASAPLEQGCFMLLREGRGTESRRLVAVDLIPPPVDAWEFRGPDVLRPSARWISAAVSRAVSERAGLLFLHAHPDPSHPPALSAIDRHSAEALGAAIGPLLDGPIGFGVVHPHGWAAAVRDPASGTLLDADRVVSIGRTLTTLGLPTHAAGGTIDDRQREALGRAHDVLRSLTVGVVGTGGLGSPIAEQLVRMGVARIILVDHDLLDTASNLRRIFGARASDLDLASPQRKVDVVGEHLAGLELGTEVVRIFGDVRHEAVFRSLLDADVVICATDTHSSRAAVNELAAPYFLPVIDVGVRAGAKANGDLAALVAEVRVLTPTTPCLWCRKSISGDTVRAEGLPRSERDRLVAEGYLLGNAGVPAPSVAALTVFGSGLAASALLGLLTPEGEACPSAYVIDGLFGDGFELEPRFPVATCRCRRRVGVADSEPPPLLP